MNDFLKKIKQIPMKETEYVREITAKNQIVLHHTAGNSSGIRTIEDWNTDKRGRIATCVVISGKNARNTTDGEICQAFSSRFWAYHLGLKSDIFRSRKIAFKNLEKTSIGIEICNFGYLKKDSEGKFRTYVNSIIPESDVIELEQPFKGHKYWHNYTDAQIESVRLLLNYWCDLYKIPKKVIVQDLFSVSDKALKGESGIFTHNSYRSDKSDIYPHPKMVEMLLNL
jgi:N-acetyl-anhydromuramyl-L-alanine amidase AmpD